MDTSPTPSGQPARRNTGYMLLGVGCIFLVLAYLIGISDNFPGIVSMLAGMFAVVLGVTVHIGKWGKRKPMQELLYWSPRALCVVVALFLSIFALDVFEEGRGFWGTAVALLMHLVPSFLVLLTLAMSWRREWVGGVLSFVLAAVWVVFAWGKPFFGVTSFLLIAGPLLLTGSLFLLNWRYRAVLKNKPAV